eukprot:11517153-Alexandrium_andersonii.AAC.1
MTASIMACTLAAKAPNLALWATTHKRPLCLSGLLLRPLSAMRSAEALPACIHGSMTPPSTCCW